MSNTVVMSDWAESRRHLMSPATIEANARLHALDVAEGPSGEDWSPSDNPGHVWDGSSWIRVG